MSCRYPNPRRVKIHRPYTIDQAARATGSHSNTVRRWIKAGLMVSAGRPILIPGRMLAQFLTDKRASRKRPLNAGEIYCLSCRAPKTPAGAIADYVPHSAATGNLRGICPDCGRLINRKVSLPRIDAAAAGLDIQFPHGLQRIKE